MPERSPPPKDAQVSEGNQKDGAELDIDRKTGRLDKALAGVRSTPAGRIGLKITVGIVGAAVVGLGLVLVPLPGPGWLIVFGGLAIWSIEFRWAKRLSAFARGKVSDWTAWYRRQGWPLRILVGLLTLVFVLAIIAFSVYFSFGSAPFDWLGRLLS
jgi:uncharacterized protein (TIGR02611 family)